MSCVYQRELHYITGSTRSQLRSHKNYSFNSIALFVNIWHAFIQVFIVDSIIQYRNFQTSLINKSINQSATFLILLQVNKVNIEKPYILMESCRLSVQKKQPFPSPTSSAYLAIEYLVELLTISRKRELTNLGGTIII